MPRKQRGCGYGQGMGRGAQGCATQENADEQTSVAASTPQSEGEATERCGGRGQGQGGRGQRRQDGSCQGGNR